MSLLKTITPPTKRRLKSSLDKVYALAEHDQPGRYLVNTATGETEIEIVAMVNDVYFSEDGRAFPKEQVSGFIFAAMTWVNKDER